MIGFCIGSITVSALSIAITLIRIAYNTSEILNILRRIENEQ